MSVVKTEEYCWLYLVTNGEFSHDILLYRVEVKFIVIQKF